MIFPRNYTPREYQQVYWDRMLAGRKRSVCVWHRRAGKDKTTWNWLLYAAVMERLGTYYFFAPTYAQGKKIIWDGMDADGFRFRDHIPPELLVSDNETEMQMHVKHLGPAGGESIIQIIGTDKINTIKGTNPVGCVFDEFSFQNPKAWDLVEPILLENRGWASFVFTPNGKNHAFKLWEAAQKDPEWDTSFLTIRDTKRPDGSPVISEAAIAQLRARGVDEEVIQQEYYCSFTGGVQGSYYGRQIDVAYKEGRIGRVPWEPQLGVETWWDLGMDDMTSIWFVQRLNREIRLIDYLENSGEGLAFYAKELRDRPYVYDVHVLPHDANVRELGTGKSRIESATTLGIRPIRVAPKLAAIDGINAVRMILPRCYFDSIKCDRGINALTEYHKEWDEERLVFSPTPAHNWTSHAADAFRTGALGSREITRGAVQDQAVTAFDPMTYDTSQRMQRGRVVVAETEFDPFGDSDE